MGVDASALWDWVVLGFGPRCRLWEGFRRKRFGLRCIGHLVWTESPGLQSGLVASEHAFVSASPWGSLRFRVLAQGDILLAASSTNMGTGIAKDA